MPKPAFRNEYSRLQREFINHMAEIEQEDANACAGCGGEDCLCCEIWHDRQRWVPADQLFDEDDEPDKFEPREYEDDDDEDEDELIEDGFVRIDPNEPSESEHPRRRGAGTTPCDILDENGVSHCPFIADDNNATNTYFCREHCGVGVDD